MATCDGSTAPLVGEYRPSPLHQLLVFASDIAYKCQNVPRVCRVIILLSFIIIGSIPREMGVVFPPISITANDGFLNVYVLEWCILWTLIFLIPFIIVLNLFRRPFSFCRLGSHLLRTAFLFFNWASTTSLFRAVEKITEDCSDPRHCKSGYHLSGHTYVMVYLTCCIAEECKALEAWRKISEKIGYDVQTGVPGAEGALRRYGKLDIAVRILLLILSFVSTIWLFGLMVTVFYYHLLMEKVLGCVFAMSSWLFTYVIWYGKPLALPAPGDLMPKEQPPQDLNSVRSVTSSDGDSNGIAAVKNPEV